MELESWLRSLGLEQYEAAFRENAIDEKILTHLTADDLKELGVAAIGHRRALLDAIAALRASAELRPAAFPPVKPVDHGAARPWPIDTAERRQVTVMFADLVGSTALSARMDPEDLRKVIAAYHKCATEIVRRFGGFVSQYLGDGVLAYFGYPEAHEDDAERAIRAGLELIAAVSALKMHAPLQTRVGIATGLVVVGDVIDAGGSQERGIIGETPNLAGRLQGLAEPNMVVIAEGTRKLLGNLFELQDLGIKGLKGIARPIRVWAVLRAISVASRFEALHAGGLSPFVGRERELEILERGLSKAQAQLHVIDVVADPGMGKSRLLHEFRQCIGKHYSFVLSGSCSPDGQQTPFLPLIEVVRGAFGVSAGEAEREIAQKLETGLKAIGLNSPQNLALLLHVLGLNVPRASLAGLDGVLIGLRTRELLQQLLEAHCGLSPVLMVIEDLQWIDAASEEVLGKIFDSKADLRLLVLTTRRPEYLPPWLNWTIVTKLHLEPLSFGDVYRLIQTRLKVEILPETLARRVAEKAEGNPLFVEETISFLTERGALRVTAGKVEFEANAVAAALPANVQNLLTARVDYLALKDRKLLQAASVIGRHFDTELLAAVFEDNRDIDSRLAPLQAVDLVHGDRNSGTYSFKHALVRDALYQSLLNQARSVLHLRIAREIERCNDNRLIEVAEILAHHYRQTDDATKAFAFLSMAGSKSLDVYSLDEAINHLTTAAALLDSHPDCASDDHVIDFLVSYLFLLGVRGEVTAMPNLIGRYLPRVDQVRDDPRIVLIRHYYVHALVGNTRYREAVAIQQQTSAMAERFGDNRSRAYAIVSEIFATTVVETKPLLEFETLKREAIKAAAATDDAYIKSMTRYVIGLNEIHRGRMTEARDSARALIRDGQVLKDPRSTGFGLWLLTWIALVSDSYVEALEHSEQALLVAITPFDKANALRGKACALVLLRRLKEGEKLLEEDRNRCRAVGDLFALTGSDGIAGVCKILKGFIRAGIRSLEEAILAREKEGYQAAADWYRLFLSEIFLQIATGNEKPSISTLISNLPLILRLTLTGFSRIQTLTERVLKNTYFDPMGHHVGHAQMILGLLYKTKKKQALALQHLTEAKRILSQFGQTPILARVETALTELGSSAP